MGARALTSHLKLDYWRAQGLKIAEGNKPGKVEDFALQNRVVLPKDFEEYLLAVDGMVQEGDNDCDSHGFSFWPLARIRSVPVECAKHGLSLPEVENPESYFVFADYLQWSWACAIYLVDRPARTNQIILVGTVRPKVVAKSFSQFVALCLKDARQLYVDVAQSARAGKIS